MGNQKPIKEWRSGAFKINLWNNEKVIDNKPVTFQTLSLQRSYKKKDENTWHNETINVRKMDLIRIQTLIQEATKEMYLGGDSNEERV